VSWGRVVFQTEVVPTFFSLFAEFIAILEEDPHRCTVRSPGLISATLSSRLIPKDFLVQVEDQFLEGRGPELADFLFTRCLPFLFPFSFHYFKIFLKNFISTYKRGDLSSPRGFLFVVNSDPSCCVYEIPSSSSWCP